MTKCRHDIFAHFVSDRAKTTLSIKNVYYVKQIYTVKSKCVDLKFTLNSILLNPFPTGVKYILNLLWGGVVTKENKIEQKYEQ